MAGEHCIHLVDREFQAGDRVLIFKQYDGISKNAKSWHREGLSMEVLNSKYDLRNRKWLYRLNRIGTVHNTVDVPQESMKLI